MVLDSTIKSKDVCLCKQVSKGLFIRARFTGLAQFPRPRLTSKSFVKFLMCSYERAGWLGSRDIAKRAGNWPYMYEHFIPVTGMNGRMNSGSLNSCIACCNFHIISIPFNCSDTALRLTEAMISPKVKFFVFCHVCFVLKFGARTRPQDLWPFLISEIGLKFSIHPANRAHVKRH